MMAASGVSRLLQQALARRIDTGLATHQRDQPAAAEQDEDRKRVDDGASDGQQH